MHHVTLRGCHAGTLAGYLQALGLLRVLSRQRDPHARLHWTATDTPVLTSELNADMVVDWLVTEYCPSPILSPWNAGSGFAANGKSPKAERTLETFRTSTESRFALLRDTIHLADDIVAEGRQRGWTGAAFWAEEHKPTLVQLCRNRLPGQAQPWIDVAVTLTTSDVEFSPLTGTGGNFGRQDLSATFLQRLTQVIGPTAKQGATYAWARTALLGGEDVPYLRDTVGQYDPGRAGGILSTPAEKADDKGFVNPWAFILTLEGTLLFGATASRRLNSASSGSALPFLTRSTPVGYASAAEGEIVKGEQWIPLWSRPAGCAEVEHLLKEGRAQWRGQQATTGLEFAMAIAALGVDRGLSAFRRFVIAARLGQNPLAVPVGRLGVAARPQEKLLREPYEWVQRLRRLPPPLPRGVASAVRRVERQMYAAAAGEGPEALRRFVVEFGDLHAAVSRSGRLRTKITPYHSKKPEDWLAYIPEDPELWIAAGIATLHDTREIQRAAATDTSPRALLTPVVHSTQPARYTPPVWAQRAGTGLHLTGATLAEALAEAHRIRAISESERRNHLKRQRTALEPEDQPGGSIPYRWGQQIPVSLIEAFALGDLDDDRIAAYLTGLLALGCAATNASPPALADAPLHPALALLLPFYGAAPLNVMPRAHRRDAPPAEPYSVSLIPRPTWPTQLRAQGITAVGDDARLRLRLAGCAPLVPTSSLNLISIDGTRLAGALLLRTSSAERLRALTAVSAVAGAPSRLPAAPDLEGV